MPNATRRFVTLAVLVLLSACAAWVELATPPKGISPERRRCVGTYTADSVEVCEPTPPRDTTKGAR